MSSRRRPPELRKGPRGGGRDRDKVVAHVEEAERSYAKSIGIRLPRTAPIDGGPGRDRRGARARQRRVAAARAAAWTQRYAARRIAWHVLDHAWEIEDRSEPTPG